MGYVKHNAIIVTSWKAEAIDAAAAKAREIGLTVAGPSESAMNGYQSFLVCPDGSKEGWEESDCADEQRELFRQYLLSTRYEDGSGALEWAEVQYGNDDCAAEVVASPWLEANPAPCPSPPS